MNNQGLKRTLGVMLLACLPACGGDPGELGNEPIDSDLEPEVVNMSGTRKVMLITLQSCATCPLVHPEFGYYANKLSGLGSTVFGYYDTVSRGKLHFTLQRFSPNVVDPQSSAFDQRAGVTAGMTNIEKAVRRAVLGAGDALLQPPLPVSFSSYDTNRDGVVSDDELTIVVVSNAATGGQNQHPTVTMMDGIVVNTTVAFSGDREPAHNIAHELAHTLHPNQYASGAIDLYGAWDAHACHSSKATLMSCTAAGGGADLWFNFDPWHRRKLGWAGSWSTLSTTASTTTFTLQTPRATFTGAKEVVIVPNPNNGLEWLELERRSRADSYDQNVKAVGVIAWYTWEHTNAIQLKVMDNLTVSGKDQAHFTLAPINCLGDPMSVSSRGKSNALKPGSSYRFKWKDGTDTGYLITVNGETDLTSSVTVAKSAAAPSCSNP
jgi:M6 family metalloprotease-like protein